MEFRPNDRKQAALPAADEPLSRARIRPLRDRATVRGLPRQCPALCLSLVMLGLVDTVALAPLALACAALPGHSVGIPVSLAVVAGVGVAAAALIVALPGLAGTRRLPRFRLGRWLRPRTISLRGASGACALARAHWLVRAVALLLLLGTLGAGFSVTVALLFLCAGAGALAGVTLLAFAFLRRVGKRVTVPVAV